jgi:hypothetical protein
VVTVALVLMTALVFAAILPEVICLPVPLLVERFDCDKSDALMAGVVLMAMSRLSWLSASERALNR